MIWKNKQIIKFMVENWWKIELKLCFLDFVLLIFYKQGRGDAPVLMQIVKFVTKKIRIFSFLSLINIGLTAQPLDTLIHQAVNENLELKILEKEYLAAIERAPQVSQRPDLQIGIGVFPLPVETRLGAQILRVGATQMFPQKGLLDGRKDLELAKAKTLFKRIEVRALNLSFQVKQAYFQLYEIQKSQSFIKQNLVILKSLENVVLAKVENGKTTVVDVLRVQLKIKEMEQEIAILKIMEAKPTTTINQLLNRDLAIPIFLSDSLKMAVLPIDKNALLAQIEANHPILKMYELQQEVAQKAISLNEKKDKPSFGVGLDYIIVNQRSDAEPSGNGRDIVQLRGTVKIPLYKQQYEAKEREERLKIDALDLQKMETLNQFKAIIEKAYTDLETARLKLNLYKSQIEITKAAIRILENDYSASGNRFDELLQLEKEGINYDLKILKAIAQSHLAKNKIEQFISNSD